MIFIRPDTFVHDERFAHGSVVTSSVVNDAMRFGNTLLVHNLEIYWKPVGKRSLACTAAKIHLNFLCTSARCAGVLSEDLSSFTNLYAQVNLYFSPHGFASTVCAHQDAQVRILATMPSDWSNAMLTVMTVRQSVFIMQLEGTKAWNLYAPKYQLALKKQLRGKAGDVVRRDEMGDLLMKARDPLCSGR